MESERVLSVRGEYSTATRYFISSLEASDPEKISCAIRQYGSIENNLQLQLDVASGEDCSWMIKKRAQNFTILTMMGRAILKSIKLRAASISKGLRPDGMKSIWLHFYKLIIFHVFALCRKHIFTIAISRWINLIRALMIKLATKKQVRLLLFPSYRLLRTHPSFSILQHFLMNGKKTRIKTGRKRFRPHVRLTHKPYVNRDHAFRINCQLTN